MLYFIVPFDGGYRIVGKEGNKSQYASPWFETYSLAEKHMERLNKRAELAKRDARSPHPKAAK